jgi:hypothetical protein
MSAYSGAGFTMEGGYANGGVTTSDGDHWVKLTSQGSPYTPDFSGNVYFWRARRAGGVWSAFTTPVQNTIPTITAQPGNLTVAAGANAYFSVAASATPLPALQWQVSTDGVTFSDLPNAAPYSGVTTATLTISAAPISLNGVRYRAVAQNQVGTGASTAAILTVTAQKSIVFTELFPTISSSGVVSNWSPPAAGPLYGIITYRGAYPGGTVFTTAGIYSSMFVYSGAGFTMEGGYANGARITDDGDYWVELTNQGSPYSGDFSGNVYYWRARRSGGVWSAFSSTAVAFPPQKIFLAFSQPSSFSLIVPTAFGRTWPIVNPFGSFPAAAISDSYRNSVTSQIKNIYSRSGIYNIEWTTSDSSDAIAVYFCASVNPDLLGYSKGPPDRFNSKRRGEVIVFVNESFPLANLDAESAAHEIGHSLGLRHVNPPVATDPSDEEVMDLDFSDSPEFINAVSDVTDITSFSTHNPLYHLHRYVDGWSSSQLQNAGISPGTWDNGSTISTRFSFQNENLRLYNITVFASGGNAESSFTLEQIPSATLAELSERDFAVPEGLGIVLLASSTTNGQPDVISSTGDAFSATNQVISPSGTNTFTLFRQDSPTNAVAVSTATAAFDAQTPYCKLFVSAPGILRLDFRGTLQTSTTLTNWTDVGAVSPHFIVIGSTNRAEFFRSRQ